MTKETHTKAALCLIPYFGWIVGVAFLVSNKDPMVRWYSLQAIVLHLMVLAVYFFAVPLMRMTIVLIPLAATCQGLVGLIFLAGSLYGCWQVYNGHEFKIPFVKDIVDGILHGKH